MKTKRLALTAAAIAALLTITPALTHASPGRDTVQIAPENARNLTADKLAGQDLKGLDGKSLGTIKDFAIATPEGSPVYAIVSAGGTLGMGDKLRLVPTNALIPDVARGRNGFNVQLDQAGWNQIATIEPQSLDSGSYPFTREQHEQLTMHFRGAEHRGASIRGGATLIRASALRGKDVRAGAEEVGEIEGVVIDLNASSASVLLETDDDFSGTNQDVVVPFNKFTLNAPKAEFIPVSLTRNDFAQLPARDVQTAARVQTEPRLTANMTSAPADMPQPRKPAVISNSANYNSAAANVNNDLAPTGRADARQDPQELLEIGARSVRDLLRAEPAFADSRIDAKAQHGHIVLTGAVSSEQLRQRIFATAKGATGFPVLNNIPVDLDRRP